MTGLGFAIILTAGVLGIFSGHLIRKLLKQRWRSWALLAISTAPLSLYLLFGTIDGCFLFIRKSAEYCYGFGFGLLLFGLFLMLPWMIGNLLGYLSPWSRTGAENL